VLTDFGIARDEDARDQTMDERVLGTLSYMAPEQAAGEQATGATDVWAAALTLYEALTGHNPYRTKSLNDLLERLSKGVKPLAHERPDLPRALSRTLQRALQRDPRRRPTAIELRDQLLAALRPEPEDEDVVSAVHHREPRELPRPDRFEQPGSSALVGASLAVMLTLYPVYPPSWTLPLAGLTALIAWRRPIAALTLGAALMLPAFWNYSQAGGLVYAALATTWIATQRPAGRRALLPLTAIPLTLLGIGPAVVLVAATARTPRRRAAEAAAGGLVAVVTGPLITHEATRHLPNSNNPLGYLAALAAAPATVLVLLSIVAFSVLLPVAWRHEGPRRVQALSLWGVGFALVTVGLPTALAGHPEALAPAAGAAALVAILPAASAVAAPRIRLGR